MKQVHINYERCIGCRHCELACIVEHSSSKDILDCIDEWAIPKRLINIEANEDGLSFPVNCRHCEFPLCMNVCPVSAIKKDEDGFVQVEPFLCIGCGICALACSFGVISYNMDVSSKRVVAIKCDGCKERLKMGEIPACVEACKTGALFYGSMDDYEKKKRESLIFKISEESALPGEILLWRDYLKQIGKLKGGITWEA